LEEHFLIIVFFKVAGVVLMGTALWRLFRAVGRRYLVRRDIRIAILGAAGFLLGALVVAIVVQYMAGLAAWRRQVQQSNAYFQAHKEEYRRNGLYLSPEDSKKFQELCPPDHLVAFAIAQKSINLPWKLIRAQWSIARNVWASTGGASCPPHPVKVGELFLYPFDPDVARARDLNLFLLHITVSEYWKNHPYDIPSNPASRVGGDDGSYFEEVTDGWRAKHSNPYIRDDFRAYRLQPAAAAGGLVPAPVEISCSDLDPKIRTRSCTSSFDYDGLFVQYQFHPKQEGTYYQKTVGLPDGPVEPAAFLSFDARLRKWLADIQRKPAS
jgi:hypothetical protein